MKPVMCPGAAASPLTDGASSYPQLELVELWKVSGAGLKGHELRTHAAGNWSILFYQATPAPLKAARNLVFILFWQNQPHLELFGCPLLQLALERYFLDVRKTCSMPPLPHTSLPSPRAAAAWAPRPSSAPCLRLQEKRLWGSLWREKKGKITDRGRAVETGLPVAQVFRRESRNAERYRM